MNAQPGESSVKASGQHLTFALAGEVFAIPILAVQEIRGWEKASQTPRLPEYVLGVVNLRDAVVPILDLRARLGMAACERNATAVVIVIRIRSAAADLVTLGCLVDGVSDLIHIAERDARPAPGACGTVDRHFLAGVATVEQQLILMLDLARLVALETVWRDVPQ